MAATTNSDQGYPQGSIEADSRCHLTGLRVLVVEDVGMVAMALKAMLEAIGCVVVGMPARLPEAENMARHETFDGVLLDLNLGGQYAFSVADILRERDIPFIIISGYDAGQLRADLAGVPLLQKPFITSALEAKLRVVFCTGSNSNAIA
jgi:CheY-like chemotaxis protein